MRKLKLYTKLALGNILRNKTTYIPYLIASATSVATFYCLLAIHNSGSLGTVRGAQYAEIVVMLGIFLLAIFCAAILFWTNSFLIKRRKKELGLYSVLGLEKGNMGIMMFIEALASGLVSLAAGLLGGLLVARLLFLFLLRVIQYPSPITLPISLLSIVETVLFFGALFLVLLLYNLRQLRKVKPVELMSDAKAGEKEPRASWLITLLGLVLVGGGYLFALTVEEPVEALLYFLVAALAVILGTYCLFTSGSIAVLKALRRNKGYYYSPKHFVPVGGLIWRMKQNAAGLASICILSCMVLVTVSSTVTLYSAGIDDYTYPRDYRVSSYEYSPDTPFVVPGLVEQAAGQQGTQAVDVLHYSLHYAHVYDTPEGWRVPPEDEQGYWEYLQNYQSAAMYSLLLDEYNAAENTSYTLAADEILFFYTAKAGFVPPSGTVTLNGVTYTIKPANLTWLGRESGEETINPEFWVVFADEDARRAQMRAEYTVKQLPEEYWDGYVMQHNYNFNLATGAAEDMAFTAAFSELVYEYVDQYPENNFNAWVSTRSDAFAEWYGMNGAFLFLGVFFGAIFLAAAALIIYYKQVSEGYDDRERFEILQKVGMSAREVKKTINSQVRTVFLLPLMVALVHIAVAFRVVARALVIFDFTDGWVQLVGTGLTFIVYALLYWAVYKQTAKTYFRIVRRHMA